MTHVSALLAPRWWFGLLLVATGLWAPLAHGQSLGIGTTAPDASAALDIVSSDKGLLLPRLTQAERTAIVAPAAGLLVYQTTAPAGFYYNAGTSVAPLWQQVGTTAAADNLGNHTATQNLNLGANQLVGNGGTAGLTISATGLVGLGGRYQSGQRFRTVRQHGHQYGGGRRQRRQRERWRRVVGLDAGGKRLCGSFLQQ